MEKDYVDSETTAKYRGAPWVLVYVQSLLLQGQ